MIQLHRLNGQGVVVNAELIESVEGNVDTVLRLATGNHLVVRENVTDVIQKVIEYRRSVYVNVVSLPEFLKGEKVRHENVGGSA